MDIDESAVLQGITAGKRQTDFKSLVDGNGDEIPGLEKEFIDQLFSVETQRAWVAEMKAQLKGVIEDLEEDDKIALKKRLSQEVGTLVLMEVRFKALEKTLGDIQTRIKAMETAGT